MYGYASLTTSGDWPIEFNKGFKAKTPIVRRKPRIKHMVTLFSKIDLDLMKFLWALLSAIKGVIAVENPIPSDIAKKTKLFPSDIAASSAVPSLPTIALSTNWTSVCPTRPIITGYANL